MPVLQNTPLPPAGFYFSAGSNFNPPLPVTDPRMKFLDVAELSDLTGICQRTLREQMAQRKFRWHGSGRRKVINLGEWLEDTEFC